jgi:hypothetical protein
MKVPPLHRWSAAGPLTLALLAALLLHGLWLAELQLRQRRQPPPQRLQRPDDTPELLVFSRQPPEPLGLESVPLPPPSALPPPPPLLPEQRGLGKPSAPPPGQGPRAGTVAGKRSGPSGRLGTASRPPARPAVRRLPLPGLRQGPPPLPPLPLAAPLEALREARARGADASPPLAGEAVQRWRTLWQSAEVGPSPPAALAARPAEAQLRRLPLAQARAEGLEPESGRPLRLDDHWLLPWIEGEQLWLLRVPG